jgi:hypothetical protein
LERPNQLLPAQFQVVELIGQAQLAQVSGGKSLEVLPFQRSELLRGELLPAPAKGDAFF